MNFKAVTDLVFRKFSNNEDINLFFLWFRDKKSEMTYSKQIDRQFCYYIACCFVIFVAIFVIQICSTPK